MRKISCKTELFDFNLNLNVWRFIWQAFTGIGNRFQFKQQFLREKKKVNSKQDASDEENNAKWKNKYLQNGPKASS